MQELEKALADEKLKKTATVTQNDQLPHAIPSRNDADSERSLWDGVHIRTARSAQETWYGPSSMHYFIRRTTNSLGATLQQTLATYGMLPVGVNKLIYTPAPSEEEATSQLRQMTGEAIVDSTTTGDYLTPTQEEYFLSLYWQSYHTGLFPILDEVDFKEQYRSLWTSSNGTERQPSALVDIILAMCMQYGISKLPATRQGVFTGDQDATIAGRWHYRRCQMLLANELESPSISTLQCHLLCTIFLCSASFQNMADSACALAVRNAYMLGLHLEPPQTMPLKERELRKRLWWAIHLLDSKIGMKLGRPFLLHDTHSRPSLPGDSSELAMLSGSDFAPPGDNVTWLSFNLQGVKLFSAARAVHTKFYESDLRIGHGQTMWDDPQVLESCAELLRPVTNIMDEWVRGVPCALKTKRKDQDSNNNRITGIPFSTDSPALDIEQFAPAWLQHQRIVLELTYHNLCINLHRPFISFVHTTVATPIADGAARKCAAHAIAMAHIIYQVLTSTSILDGWHEAFQFQWNAAVALVGFASAYPGDFLTLAVKEAINVSISVFDHFGNSFAVATSAASILRNMGISVDSLFKQGLTHIQEEQGDTLGGSEAAALSTTQAAFDQPQLLTDFGFAKAATDGSLGFDNIVSQDAFELAIDVDFWSNLDILWQNTNASSTSSFMQEQSIFV